MFIGFETILSMYNVIFHHWIFYIFLKGQIFGGVPLNHNLHIPSFTLQKLRNTSMGMYAVTIATLFWPPSLNPSFHTKSTFEKGDFVEFWILMDWDNGVCPMLWINEGKTMYYESPTCENPWNTPTSLQIIITLINQAIKP